MATSGKYSSWMRVPCLRVNMKKRLTSVSAILCCLLLISCTQAPQTSAPAYTGQFRSIETSFESASDFDGFYIVPSGAYDSSHNLSTEQVYDGTYAHKAWILKSRAKNNDGFVYLPHRAYPTLQFHKLEGGVLRTPVLVSLWIYLDINLTDREKGIDDWFSPITLSSDPSDDWSRVVTVGLGPDGYMKLVHVPNHNEQEHIYQASIENDLDGKLLFSQKKWVRLDLFIDFDSENGYAKLWQDGVLISHAKVNGGKGTLAQGHLGMYASAAVPSGIVYNDKLRIREIADETEAIFLVESD